MLRNSALQLRRLLASPLLPGSSSQGHGGCPAVPQEVSGGLLQENSNPQLPRGSASTLLPLALFTRDGAHPHAPLPPGRMPQKGAIQLARNEAPDPLRGPSGRWHGERLRTEVPAPGMHHECQLRLSGAFGPQPGGGRGRAGSHPATAASPVLHQAQIARDGADPR